MNKKFITMTIIVLLISVALASIAFATTINGGGGGQPGFIINLEPGWNSVSSPLQEGIDIQVIKNACGDFVQVEYWTGTSYESEYSKLESGKGYYVLVNNSCGFSIGGTPYSLAVTIPPNGTQFIGASSKKLNVEDVLGTCRSLYNEGTIEFTSYDRDSETYTPTSILEVGKAYWVENKGNMGCFLFISCEDSDNGKDYYKAGFVTYRTYPGDSGTINSDYCKDGSIVEHYCEKGQDKTIEYSCPYGCVDSACISTPECGDNICSPGEKDAGCVKDCVGAESWAGSPLRCRIYVSDTGKINSLKMKLALGNGAKFRYYIWEDNNGEKGSEIAHSELLQMPTYDSYDWYESTSIASAGSSYAYINSPDYYWIGVVKETSGTKAFNTRITNDGNANTYAEDENNFRYPNWDCVYGLSVGEDVACKDSDGGINYYVKGTKSDKCGASATDVCVNENLLLEYTCLENNPNECGYGFNYNCPYGCKDGACIQETRECSVHSQCSQACDDLGINFHWSGTGSNYKSWSGVCPSNVLGCMTGQCCLGQCEYRTTGDCVCRQTNKVDIYGSVCSSGTGCGSDCYCHPLTEEYKTVNVGDTFDISASASDTYKWELTDSREEYLRYSPTGLVACTTTGVCTYPFQFTALKEGQTRITLNKINKNDNSVVEVRYFHITITSSEQEVVQLVYLNRPFILKESGKAEVVDYKNMRIKLNTVQAAPVATGGGSGGYVSPSGKYVIIEVSMINYGTTTASGAGTTLIIYEGQTKSIFGADIKVEKIDLVYKKATFLVTLPTTDFNFKIDAGKYTYSPGETVRINAVLSGSSNLYFKNAKVRIYLKDPNGRVIDLPVNSIGAVASGCAVSTTTNAYTCPVWNQYSFYAYYKIPTNAPLGAYSVTGKVNLGNIEKHSYDNFRIEKIYSGLVEVDIQPKRMTTEVGEPVEYRVTITDKHPILRCPLEAEAEATPVTGSTIATEETTTEVIARCGPVIYNYAISVYGLPYHSVYPTVVGVHAGSSKTFELRVFPSSVRTAEGITTAVRKAEIIATEIAPTEERAVSITGQPIATEPSLETMGEFEAQPAQVNDALFRFTVKVNLREDASVSDSDTAVLYVRFVQVPKPPPFPEEETISMELKRGWNLISLPGKGLGFTQGTCSAIRKPLAYVYLQDHKRYASIEEALKIMGAEKLLEYLSTHSFWIYSYEDCKLGFKVTSYSTYSELSLVQGWNLLGTTKDMVGETLSNIKGTCTFEKVYIWNAESQEWIEKSESDLIEEMGYGVLVKTSSACRLKTNTIQPPAIPEG
ncbi:MAG: hypothetical protein GTN36_02445 [Candidatus Aenigmarchaeota archaeon]|nr:hypothetical protein [Candidatus Aenigmarchaeota archaeon]